MLIALKILQTLLGLGVAVTAVAAIVRGRGVQKADVWATFFICVSAVCSLLSVVVASSAIWFIAAAVFFFWISLMADVCNSGSDFCAWFLLLAGHLVGYGMLVWPYGMIGKIAVSISTVLFLLCLIGITVRRSRNKNGMVTLSVVAVIVLIVFVCFAALEGIHWYSGITDRDAAEAQAIAAEERLANYGKSEPARPSAEEIYELIRDGDTVKDEELVEAIMWLHANENPRLGDRAQTKGNLMSALDGVTAAADKKVLAAAAISNVEMTQNVVMGVKYRPTTENEFKTALEAVLKLDSAELVEEAIKAVDTLANAEVWHGTIDGTVLTTRAVYDADGNYHLGWKTDTKKDCKVLCVEVDGKTVRFQAACGQLTVPLKSSGKAPAKQVTKPAEQAPVEQKPVVQQSNVVETSSVVIIDGSGSLQVETSGSGSSGRRNSSDVQEKDSSEGVQNITGVQTNGDGASPGKNEGAGVNTSQGGTSRNNLPRTADERKDRENFVKEDQDSSGDSNNSSGDSSGSSSGNNSGVSSGNLQTFDPSGTSEGLVSD